MKAIAELRKSTVPTLNDVADLARVSTATVSRCLNAPDAVRPERRLRVEQAIGELGYRPHMAARALAARKSWTVGGIFPRLDSTLFGGVMETFQKTMCEAGYAFVVFSSDYDPQIERELIHKLVADGADAVLLVGADHDVESLETLEDRGVPYVQTWAWDDDITRPTIGFDNAQAAELVATYLADIGHREFAMISGLVDGNDRAASRLAGARRALSARGVELSDAAVMQARLDIADGRRAFRHLMVAKSRPTAVMCGSDVLALGALFEAQAMGISVPGDISITGFGDVELAAHVTPALTTVYTPRREMGTLAAAYLLACMEGRTVPAQSRLEARLVVRESTAPPRIR